MFKKTPSRAWLLALFILATWPWTMFMLDTVSWALTGETMTSIPWKGPRGEFLVVGWPMFCVITAVLVAAIIYVAEG